MGGGPGYAAHVGKVLAEDLVSYIEAAKERGSNKEDFESILQAITEIKKCLEENEDEWEIYYRVMCETVGAEEWKTLQLMVHESNKQAARFHLCTTLAAADKGYRSLDTFVSWFVAGTGAALGLIIANLDRVSPYIEAVALKWAMGLVVVALVLVGIAKFLGSIICASAGAMDKALSETDAWRQRGWDFPSDQAMEHAREEGTPRWFRYYPKFLRATDPSVISRQTLTRLAVAGISSLLATALVTSALVIVAAGITFGVRSTAASPIHHQTETIGDYQLTGSGSAVTRSRSLPLTPMSRPPQSPR